MGAPTGLSIGLSIVEAFGGLDARGIVTEGLLEPGADRSGGPISTSPSRNAYSRPRLTRLAHVDELIDALGPAQAGYGGSGLIP